ncbi:predicted protein [Histoplasma capsulatum G186AR]|uniref:Uncharacterized protein n=1 Tax=Ajellomyces capsulatus (strain G186AR / H82 / ATCC MYA-2454 / RMSCC 2432) TaxID=447093 RepID=C0P1D6_AJECG|nr:uncharacterized protein HCBG_09216 [Histoplasma capsulatum G186AR]EEH02537.1 predicted protein [Histoplasma capsulatum G186AR]
MTDLDEFDVQRAEAVWLNNNQHNLLKRGRRPAQTFKRNGGQMKYKYQGGKTTGQGVGGVRVRANLAANDEGEGNTSEHETSSDGARKKLSSINEPHFGDEANECSQELLLAELDGKHIYINLSESLKSSVTSRIVALFTTNAIKFIRLQAPAL